MTQTPRCSMSVEGGEGGGFRRVVARDVCVFMVGGWRVGVVGVLFISR